MASMRGGCSLGALVVAASLCLTSPARADHEGSACGDFGGLGVAFGAVVGLGVGAVGALSFPAIARASNPSLPYWPGVGYTMAAGTGGVLVTAGLLSKSCDTSSLFLPTLVVIPLEALTTAIWAAPSKPKPKPQDVSLVVAAPHSGQGVVVGFGKAF